MDSDCEKKGDPDGYPPCKCGQPSTIHCSQLKYGDTHYCKACDPDPDIDESDICYSCGDQSHRSSYIGAGIYLGVCESCDTGQMLGYEHLGW